MRGQRIGRGGENVKLVVRDLEKAALKLGERAAHQAALAAAQVVKKAIVDEAPEDTGFLKTTVKIVDGGSSEKGSFVTVEISDGDFAGHAFYAAMVEYGTKDQRANPFIRRAVDKSKGEAARAAAAAFNLEVSRG